MKVSLNWIKDYVDLPQDMDLTRLAYDLTMSTVEVEGAEDLARRFDHMLVGRIVEVCPHPNADKLQICRTDIGGGDIRDIVCGGTNVRPGMKVAVAAPGPCAAGTVRASRWRSRRPSSGASRATA